MPITPLNRFNRALVKLGTQRNPVHPEGFLSTKGRAQYAYDELEALLDRKVRSVSGILTAQNLMADLLAHAAYGFTMHTHQSTGGTGPLPTKSDIREFLKRDVIKLIFVIITIPPNDSEAAARVYENHVKRLIRRAMALVHPWVEEHAPIA